MVILIPFGMAAFVTGFLAWLFGIVANREEARDFGRFCMCCGAGLMAFVLLVVACGYGLFSALDALQVPTPDKWTR